MLIRAISLLVICCSLSRAQIVMAPAVYSGAAPAGWTQVDADDFNRANETLTDPWNNMHGNVPQIISNALAGVSASGDIGCYLGGGGSYNASQAAQLDYTVTSSSQYIGVLVRCGSEQGYGFYVSTTDSYFFRVDAGPTWVQLGTAEAGFSLNDKIRIEVEGTTITAYGGASGTTLIDTRTDGTYNGGTVGIWTYDGTTARADNFVGYTK